MEYQGFPILQNFFLEGRQFDFIKTIGANPEFNNIDDSFTVNFNLPFLNEYFKHKK